MCIQIVEMYRNLAGGPIPDRQPYLQSAIDNYVLSLGAAGEARLGPLEAGAPGQGDSSSGTKGAKTWSEWGLPFPSAAYNHNRCAGAPVHSLLCARVA